MIDWKKAARGFLEQRNNVERVWRATERRLSAEQSLAWQHENQRQIVITQLGYVVAAMKAMDAPSHWPDRIQEAMVMLGWDPPPGAMPPGMVEELRKARDENG